VCPSGLSRRTGRTCGAWCLADTTWLPKLVSNLHLVYITQPTGEGPPVADPMTENFRFFDSGLDPPLGPAWGLPSPSESICRNNKVPNKKNNPQKVKKPNKFLNGLNKKAWCEGVSIETRLLGLTESTSTTKKKKKKSECAKILTVSVLSSKF
jgi:hypothetical protein